MNTSLNKNSLWTSFSIVIVLFIFGIYGVIIIHSNYVGQKIKEQLNVVAEFTKDYNDADKSHLFEELRNHEAVIASSLNFYNQDEARELMMGDLGDAFLEDEDGSPFRDVVVFNVKHEYYTPEYLNELSTHLQTRDYINDVVYQEEFQQLLEKNLKDLALIPLLIGILMCVLTIALIYNTVQLALQSDTRQIKTMKLVGASQQFIKRPYIRSSIRMGIISAGIAIVLLLLILQVISVRLAGISGFFHYPYIFLICLLLLIIGVCIPLVATQTILSSHLKRIHVGI